jgi:arginine:ornithine antiporter / lysine permease
LDIQYSDPVFLIVTPFAESAFTLILKMTSVMTLVPYFLVAAYGWQLAWKGGTYDANPHGARLTSSEGRWLQCMLRV